MVSVSMVKCDFIACCGISKIAFALHTSAKSEMIYAVMVTNACLPCIIREKANTLGEMYAHFIPVNH